MADSSPSQAPNPFAAQAVQETDFTADLVDVWTLHDGARQALARGLARVRGGRPYLAAIVGEPGSGKSHLLWWLRRQQSANAGLFVTMSALPDLAQPFRHALKQLVSALCRKETAGPSSPLIEKPIDRLMWEVLYTQTCDLLDAARVGMYQGPAALLKLIGPLCTENGRRRDAASFAAAAQPVWQKVEPGLRAYLLSLPTEMSIDSAARAVVVQYPYADRRALCTAWFAGEDLGPKDRERLGAKQVINNEAAAKYVLCALCRLLSFRPKSVLTLVYDQVDAVAQQLERPGIQSVAEVISAVQAQGGATMQVLTCRPETWSLFLDKPTRPGPGQLKHIDDTLTLGRPTKEQLRELITARAGKAGVAPTANLDPASWPADVATPRALLLHLATRWSGLTDSVPQTAIDSTTAKITPLSAKELAATMKDAPSHPGAAAKRDAPSGPGVAAKTGKDGPSRVPIAKKDGPSTPPKTSTATAKGNPGSGEVLAAKPSPFASRSNLGSGEVLAAKPSALPNRSAPGSGEVLAFKPAAVFKKGTAPSGEALALKSSSVTAKGAGTSGEVLALKSSAITTEGAGSSGENPAISESAATIKGAGSSGDNLALRTSAVTTKGMVSSGEVPAVDLSPSSQSPSVTWMAMASDDDPLAAALAKVDAESEAPPIPAPKPQPATPSPQKVAGKSMPLGAKPMSKSIPMAKRAESKPPTPKNPDPAPSSSSPSVTWMAMASDDDPLAAAIAEAGAELGIGKVSVNTKAAPKMGGAAALPTPSSQSPSVTWMAMASDDDPLSAALAAAAAKEQAEAAANSSGAVRPVRSTKERLKAVEPRKAVPLTAEQVLATIGQRGRVEEWQLAQEMGVAIGALGSILTQLEDEGAVRLVTTRDGQRTIARL